VKAGPRLALLAGLLAPPAWADAGWQAELATAQEWQQWRETGSDGRRLVSEDGRLAGLSAALRWTAPGVVQFGLRQDLLWGVRSYRGLSNRGAELQTRSELGQALTRLDGTLAPRPLQAGWSWQPVAAAEFWQWKRRLRDTPQASGYPERYRQGLLLLGLQAQGEGGTLARLEVGGGWGGRNRVELPGRDPASLPLGAAASLRLMLGGELAPAWRWSVTAERLTLQAGDERPVTLQGVPLQSARQPRTEQRRLQLQLSWRS